MIDGKEAPCRSERSRTWYQTRAHANRGIIMLLRRQDAEAQRDFAKAIEFDSSLKADLEKSIDQIRKARQENATKP